jgi:hypothetical protein
MEKGTGYPMLKIHIEKNRLKENSYELFSNWKDIKVEVRPLAWSSCYYNYEWGITKKDKKRIMMLTSSGYRKNVIKHDPTKNPLFFYDFVRACDKRDAEVQDQSFLDWATVFGFFVHRTVNTGDTYTLWKTLHKDLKEASEKLVFLKGNHQSRYWDNKQSEKLISLLSYWFDQYRVYTRLHCYPSAEGFHPSIVLCSTNVVSLMWLQVFMIMNGDIKVSVNEKTKELELD